MCCTSCAPPCAHHVHTIIPLRSGPNAGLPDPALMKKILPRLLPLPGGKNPIIAQWAPGWGPGPSSNFSVTAGRRPPSALAARRARPAPGPVEARGHFSECGLLAGATVHAGGSPSPPAARPAPRPGAGAARSPGSAPPRPSRLRPPALLLAPPPGHAHRGASG